jgi:hypothetical protein
MIFITRSAPRASPIAMTVGHDAAKAMAVGMSQTYNSVIIFPVSIAHKRIVLSRDAESAH